MHVAPSLILFHLVKSGKKYKKETLDFFSKSKFCFAQQNSLIALEKSSICYLNCDYDHGRQQINVSIIVSRLMRINRKKNKKLNKNYKVHLSFCLRLLACKCVPERYHVYKCL